MANEDGKTDEERVLIPEVLPLEPSELQQRHVSILPQTEIALDRLATSIDHLVISLEGIGRRVTQLTYMVMGVTIIQVVTLGFIAYNARSLDKEVRDFIDVDRELTYQSQQVTVPRSIAEARRDIETIRNGGYPHYDILVIYNIITGNYDIPANLKTDAQNLNTKFVEHERKTALAENPNKYRNELLELLTQKVNLEQKLLIAMPADYVVRPRF